MQRSTRRAGRWGASGRAAAALLLVPLLLLGAGAAPAAAQSAGVRLRAASAAEREAFLRALDGMWIPFGTRADAFSALDSLVLDDVASVLEVNPSLQLRLWATAPDAPDRDSATVAGAGTALAARRRGAVRGYLLDAGVAASQLGELAVDTAGFPAGGAAPPPDVRWRTTGGAFLFVAAADGDELLVPFTHARVRVRARPGSEVFFLPRSIAERDSTLACAPPRAARFEVVGADSTIERPYPPRPVLTVARDTAGVIVTRHHEVDARRDPDLVDLLAALPDPRCRR